SSRQVANAVNQWSRDGTKNSSEIAELLVKTAYQAGSQDNISAMVINLSSQPALVPDKKQQPVGLAPLPVVQEPQPEAQILPLETQFEKSLKKINRVLEYHPLHKKGKNTTWARIEMAKEQPGTMAIVRSTSDPSRFAAAITKLDGTVDAKFIE